MTRPFEYFRRALALPRGGLLLLGQGALIVIALWTFIHSIPWMMSHDISEIGNYEDPIPKPPRWARAFSVDHGTFVYYPESRSDAPAKFWGVITLFVAYGVVYHIWTKSVWKQGERLLQQRDSEQDGGGQPATRPESK
jgi:hypothetical protein